MLQTMKDLAPAVIPQTRMRNTALLGSMLSVQLDDAALQRCDDCFGAVFHSEFAHNVFEMRFRGVFGEVQSGGNLFVTQSFRQEFEYFLFTLGEIGARDTFGDAA